MKQPCGSHILSIRPAQEPELISSGFFCTESKSFALARAFSVRASWSLMDERLISDALTKRDNALEVTLRPPAFSEFTGQPKVKERIEIALAAARKLGEALNPVLLSGPPGLGKTTLALIISKAMGPSLKCTSGPTIEKACYLAGLLTNLDKGDVLFIDEIHRLQKNIEEYL